MERKIPRLRRIHRCKICAGSGGPMVQCIGCGELLCQDCSRKCYDCPSCYSIIGFSRCLSSDQTIWKLLESPTADDLLLVHRCPICFENSLPIQQCIENGHLLCSHCCNRLQTRACPLCRSTEGFCRCPSSERTIRLLLKPSGGNFQQLLSKVRHV